MKASRQTRECSILGLVLLALAACQATRPTSQELACTDCNVLLVSIDTLRADHLGAYGHDRDVSPEIDRFAARSFVFERAYSVSYHTADSHMSIFTSLYPSVHGVRNAKQDSVHRLSQGIPTLAEALQASGYRTAGFHGGGNVAPIYGFDRGFDVYERSNSVDDPIRWMQDHADDKLFVFFHTYHVHDPYLPSPPFNTLFDPDYEGDIVSDAAELAKLTAGGQFKEKRDAFWKRVDPEDPADLFHVRALYDGAIREIDGDIGRLLAAAEAHPRKTLIVLTSDHGEEFYEHGRFLHDQLYNETLHVPLIIRHPEILQGRRIAPRISQIDLAPTLLDLLGLPALPRAQGKSLLPVMAAQSRAPRPPIFSEKVFLQSPATQTGAPGNTSVILAESKLVKHQRRAAELFDLDSDPGEDVDLSRRDPRRSQRLHQVIERFSMENERLRLTLHSGVEGESQDLDPETLQQLKALGYI